MSVAEWSLVVGALMITMVLAGTLLGRLPLSSAMVYLALGWLLGPDGTDVLRPDPFVYAPVLERLAEVALLISLFSVGLLGLHPLGPGWLRWWSVDLLWATAGGIVIGAALGAMTGRFGVYLRSRHAEALGLDGRSARTLVTLVLWTVAASIVVHGLTAQPLMQRYLAWRMRHRARPPRKVLKP